MEFVYPIFLFALSLLAIPILIHLFHFRKYKTIYFSSIQFVKAVDQEQNSPRKVKHLLILLARILALTCLILAFAQPYFPNHDSVQKNARNVVGVYVDNSFSMSRLGKQGELLNHAKQLASSFVKDSPRNTQFLLFSNELDGSQKKVLSKVETLEVIDKIAYSPLVRSKKELLTFWDNWLSDYSQNNESSSSIRLVYFSDFQQDKNSNLTHKFINNISLAPVQLRPENTGNLFIDSIWFASPIQRLGSSQTLYVRVQNSSPEQIKAGVVTVQLGKTTRDLFTDIAPYGQDTVELTYFNQQLGPVACKVNINDKQMTQDDAFYFNYEVKKSCKVLIIDGEDAVNNVQSVYQLDPYFQIKTLRVNEFSSVYMSDFDLVVLNGLNQFPSFLSKQLSEYYTDKGSILLLPGSSIAMGSWNNFFTQVKLPHFTAVQQTGLNLSKIAYHDPFFDGMFEQTPRTVNLPTVSQAYRYREQANSQQATLIQYQNGNAFLMKTRGNNYVYLLTTSLDSKFTSFTSNQLFSALLLHIGKLAQNKLPLYLVIGSDSHIPVSETGKQDVPIKIVAPGMDFVPKVFQKNHRTFISFSGIEAIRQIQAGNFQVKQGDANLAAVSLNYNRNESETKPIEAEQISADFKRLNIDIKSIQEGSDWNSASILDVYQHRELWRIFVILAGFFLLCEMIIQIFYKK
jgi:hypothetical protein